MESDRLISPLQDGASDVLHKMRPPHGRITGPTRRSTKGQWTAEEDEILRVAVQRFKGKNWKKIAECFKDRSDVQCLHRWQKVLNPELVKGPWSKEEDEAIVELVDKYGAKKWSTIAQHLPGRIGKQCRERWHNHLNPTINKQAWTQEEELALIRAHQIYGNKWAELTKFLPGRSDNSIKNHWNSSVKKKLESYITSGLVSQYQGLPHVGHQNQTLPSSSSRIQHSSGDDSCSKDGTEAEDTSVCSQSSIVIGSSQCSSDTKNSGLHPGREHLPTDDYSSKGKEQWSSPASSQRYYRSVEDINVTISEMPYEVECTFPEQDFTRETENVAKQDTHLNLHEFSNLSSLERSDLITQCVRSDTKHEATLASLHASLGFDDTTFMDLLMSCNQPEHFLISEGGLCTSAGNFKVSENVRSLASQGDYPAQSNTLETPSCHFSVDHDRSIYGSDLNLYDVPSVETQEHEFVARTHENFVLTNNVSSFHCNGDNDTDKISPEEQNDQTSHSCPIIETSRASDSVQTCPIIETSVVKTEQHDAGALFYEPPRFPSLDIPFLSCDLIQSGTDMQHEYSPLGLRQLTCFTPFRSWDSPLSRDNSPDAVLRSAAKTFTGTPSILKKRHRDLLSPLSERRSDKKVGRDFNQRSLSSLARDFSQLDVMFDENMTSPSSAQKRNAGGTVEYKEKVNDAFKGGNVDGSGKTESSLVKTSEKDFDSSNCENRRENVVVETGGKIHGSTDDTDQFPSGVLAEHNLNNLLFFSPECFQSSSEKDVDLSSSSNEAKSSGNASMPVTLTSPIVKRGSIKSAPSSTPLKILVGNSRHDAGFDNATTFVESPFKRGIGSPPTWLSPWLFNSFLPGPRVDSEITIEDIGYFMSPGDRSYDAIGLMKQLSEHTAAAFADAQEVLSNETSKLVSKERQSYNQDHDRSHLSADILTERRVLDFSECGTPGKSKDNGQSSNSRNLSSPSSYLMKICR